MDPEEKSRIEELKKSLYSRTAADVRKKRRLHFRPKEFDIKTNWQGTESEPVEEVVLNKHYEDNSMSFFTKLLIGSSIFFVGAIALGAYLLLNGSNLVSANNVDIIVSGPVSVSGGDSIPFNIQVENKNNVKLESVDLVIDFPSGTANPNDVSKELKTFRQTIKDIEPGGIDQEVVTAAFFGEENSKKEINIKVEYHVKGSNAIFYKEKAYEVILNSSPVSLTATSFTEVKSGQEFDLSVVVSSNSNDILKNLVLKGAYPAGFSFISSNMKPVGNNATWKIGDLPPKSKKTIVIKGKLVGQDDEERVFRFFAGAADPKNDKTIGTQYIASTNNVTIKKPFITVQVALGGDSQNVEYNGQFDKSIQAEVTWFNNLPTTINDAEIHVKLSGSAYDKVSVAPDQGFYNSANREIVWNRVTTRELDSIAAGGSGRVTFSITPRDLSTPGRPIQNPDISLDVSVLGNRISESNVPEEITSSANRHVKVASNIGLSGQIVRSIGPFTNTGPIPPRAEQQTTYTVVWTVYNTSSNVSNTRVTSTLPPYVKWMDKISPTTEDISYNSVNGQITWNVGNVSAYTGSGSRKKEASFQINLQPSVTQVGQTLTLVNEAVLKAIDEFTGAELQSSQSLLNTRFSSDPTFKNDDERVTE